MKVTIEDVSTVKKTLHIEVPENDVTDALDSAYQDLKRNAKVKGFRPGKTPRSVLERFYKKDVHADVAARLIQDSFVEAVKENDLKLVGKPEVNPSDLEKNHPFAYDATIEVTPELDPIDFKGIPLEKTLHQASDEELDVQLKMLQKNMARHEPLDEERPAAKDDIVLIDYEGFENDRPLENTQKTTDFSLKIGEGRIHEDLDAQLIGLNPGDEEKITVQFAEDYFNKKLAGRKVTFQVQLKEIRKESLPEINDSFAKGLGPYKNLDELKEKITENLQEGYDKRAEQEVNEQIFAALLEKTEFEVPDALVENELNSIINEAEQSFAARNMNLEDAGLNVDQMREKYRDVAIKQVKRQLILSKIIAQEELVLSDDETETGLKEMADAYQQPVDSLKEYFRTDENRLEYFKHALLEKRAIKLIMEHGDIKEVPPNKDKKSVSEKETDEPVDQSIDG
ncbi:MAG: trigger factor [Thermodesulfobacteriota bacterium]|nr:trigger factor [Thermodesulfobacteriota bacterium]